MKPLTLTLCIIILFLPLFSRAQHAWPDSVVNNALELIKADSEIIKCDHYESSFESYKAHKIALQPESRRQQAQSNLAKITNEIKTVVIPLMYIDKPTLFDKNRFNYFLDFLVSPEANIHLRRVLKDLYLKALENKNPEEVYYPDYLKTLLSLTDKRLEEVLNNTCSFYRLPDSKSKTFKGVYMEHTNDFLSLGRSKYNDDRDLTGAFRFEVFTDLMKLRLINSDNNCFFNFNGTDWISYQSFLVGGEGYTPFLRDTTIFKNATSVDSTDRPYASFQYFGWSKYRINRIGTIRMQTQFKIGSMGKTLPDNIQSTIHRDIVIGSKTPNGWESQIAAGGRIAYNLDFTIEPMLISSRNLFLFQIRNYFIEKVLEENVNAYNQAMKHVNISMPIELRGGIDMTSYGIGIRYSTADFRTTSPGGMYLNSTDFFGDRSFLEKILARTCISSKIAYRYVIHNSMLEGYGIKSHQEDEDPKSPKDPYVIESKNIVRDVWIWELAVSLKLKHFGLVYKHTFMTKEYNLPVNYMQYPYGADNGNIPGNHNRSENNHVGTIGIFFSL